MEETLLEKLKTISKGHMEKDKLYHDYAHVLGVYSNVEKLLEFEQGDNLVLLTAALFHDICRDKENHDREGAKLTEEILNGIEDFPKDKTPQVINLIKKHEKGQLTHEEKIFADADKMEAFTMLGFARGLMMFAKWDYTLKKSIFTYEELLDMWFKGFYFDKTRELVELNYQTLKKELQTLQDRYIY